jgi:hypothetical protein
MNRHGFGNPKDEIGKRTSSVLSTSNALINFYRHDGPDFKGLYLEDIVQWDMKKLESDHSYIQTLFPLPERKIRDPNHFLFWHALGVLTYGSGALASRMFSGS